MKNCSFILFFLLFVEFSQSQVFNKNYNNYSYVYTNSSSNNSYYNDDGFSGIICRGKNFFVTGSSNNISFFGDSNNYRKSCLSKIDAFGDTIFQRYFDNSLDGFEQIGQMFLYENGTMVTSGRIVVNENLGLQHYNGYILKIDTNGNYISHYELDYGEDTSFPCFLTTDEGRSFIFLGFSDIDSTINRDYNIFLSKIDSSGNLKYKLEFGGTNRDLAKSMAMLDNGNILVYGETRSYGAGNNDLYLFETDTLGNVIWSKTYGYPGYEQAGNKDGLLVISNNCIFIAGSTELMNGNHVAWLLKLDLQGNIIWEKKFSRTEEFEIIQNIYNTSSGDIILSGSSYDTTINSNNLRPRCWLIKIDSSGNIIWDRLISRYPDDFDSDTYNYIGLLLENNEIVVGGYIINSSIVSNGVFNNNDAWLCKTDSCGYTVGATPISQFIIDSIVGYTMYISNTSQDYCSAFLDFGNGDSIAIYAYSEFSSGVNPTQLQYTYADTGNYEIILYTYAGDAIDTFMLSLALQDTSTGITSFEDEFALSIFPNPSQDFFILELAQLNQAQEIHEAQIEIININGQTVFSSNLNPALFQQKVNTSSLTNGVYLIKVTINQQYVNFNKWVKMD